MWKKRLNCFMLAILIMAIAVMTSCQAQPSTQDEPATQLPASSSPTASSAAEQARESKPTSSAEEDVTLKFIHIWPEHQEVMEETVKMIEDKYGFNIDLSVVPWDQITGTIQTSLASSDMYDVFFSWGGQIPGYRQINAVLDLTPYFDADPAWKSSFIYDNVFKEMSFEVDNKIYGIPFRGTGEFMIYNKSLFTEKGYTVPKTREELVTLMDKMINDGIIPVATFGTPNAGRIWDTFGRLTDYILLESGTLNDPLHIRGRLLDYKGQLAQGAEMAREWYKKGYFGENPFGVQREEAQTVFFSGKAGMLWCNNNELKDLRALEKEFGIEIDTFNFPAPAGAKEIIGYGGMNDGFAAYANTKYPDQAAELMKGLTMMDVQKLWGDKAHSVMCVKGVDYSDPLLVAWAKEFAESKKHPVSIDYNTGNLDELNQALLVEFMMSDMSPEDFESQYLANRAQAIKDAESTD